MIKAHPEFASRIRHLTLESEDGAYEHQTNKVAALDRISAACPLLRNLEASGWLSRENLDEIFEKLPSSVEHLTIQGRRGLLPHIDPEAGRKIRLPDGKALKSLTVKLEGDPSLDETRPGPLRLLSTRYEREAGSEDVAPDAGDDEAPGESVVLI